MGSTLPPDVLSETVKCARSTTRPGRLQARHSAGEEAPHDDGVGQRLQVRIVVDIRMAPQALTPQSSAPPSENSHGVRHSECVIQRAYLAWRVKTLEPNRCGPYSQMTQSNGAPVNVTSQGPVSRDRKDRDYGIARPTGSTLSHLPRNAGHDTASHDRIQCPAGQRSGQSYLLFHASTTMLRNCPVQARARSTSISDMDRSC